MAMLGLSPEQKLASIPWKRQQEDLAAYLPPLPGSRTANKELTWVNKQYSPLDQRSTAPVPRHKALYEANSACLPIPPNHWIPPTLHVAPSSWSREHEQYTHYMSQPATRCEEWSTLRQMLPSRGAHRPPNPPSWGTGLAPPPLRSAQRKESFPHVNSPMTRFVDSMAQTNRLFTLH